MESAASLPTDPVVGRHFSELPFINAHMASSFGEAVHQMLSSSEDRQNDQSVVLYLRTALTRPVLLEMTATVVGMASARVVILTGRQMDPALGGLFGPCVQSAIVPSQLGENTTSESEISSLSMTGTTGTIDSDGDGLGLLSPSSAAARWVEYRETEWLREAEEAKSHGTSCACSEDMKEEHPFDLVATAFSQ